MTAITDQIIEELNDDMVSHGWLIQIIEEDENCHSPRPDLQIVLAEVLAKGVEIGVARSASPDHVEFIAWKGTIAERIARAVDQVKNCSGPDKDFAYWLCLRRNVDRFEDDC